MIIVRYLIRETLKSQFAIFFVLFLVFLSQKFISVLADASDGDIPASMILSIVGLNMPSMGLLMLPLSLYIGILITFGRLYAESEIVVMNATGIGNKFLVQAALYLAILTAGIAAFNSLWLSPWSQDKVETLMEKVAAENSVDLLLQGQFQRTPDGSAVVFIDSIKDKRLNNVFVAQLSTEGKVLPSVLFAEGGEVRELSDGQQVIVVDDGTRYEGLPTRLEYMISTFEQYQGVIGQRSPKSEGRDWEAMPTHQLWSNPNLEAQAELQWRISLFVCIPLLTMLVIPLSAVNPRQGRFAKMGPAILIYLAYFLSISAMKAALEDGAVPVQIGMWPINIGLFLVALAANYMDSIPVRRIKESWRKRRAA